MAKDMLDAVLNAESECKIREAEAKAKAEQAVLQAEKDCGKLKAKVKAEAESRAQAMFEKARSDGKKELTEAVKLSEIKCKKISETAEKNRLSVIKNAVNYLID